MLERAERVHAAGEYITGSSSLRARPSPCSPDSDPPCEVTRCAASARNRRITRATRLVQREVDPDVDAAVPEVPVEQPVQLVASHERLRNSRR